MALFAFQSLVHVGVFLDVYYWALKMKLRDVVPEVGCIQLKTTVQSEQHNIPPTTERFKIVILSFF